MLELEHLEAGLRLDLSSGFQDFVGGGSESAAERRGRVIIGYSFPPHDAKVTEFFRECLVSKRKAWSG